NDRWGIKENPHLSKIHFITANDYSSEMVWFKIRETPFFKKWENYFFTKRETIRSDEREKR
ncbi:MAG: hypothetical protein ACI35R_11910, partial [Bacillus sp. (in: firmicutes)]